MVEIKFTTYAEETLLDRKISKETIKDALINPDEIVAGKYNRKIAHKIIKDKLLRVVHEEEDEKAYIVITAYYAEPRRYLK